MPQVPIRCPFGELDLCAKLRLYHTQFFISSLGPRPLRSCLFWHSCGASRPVRMKEGSMKLRVAYNQYGEILAVTEGGSFEKAKFEDFVHRLHVDVHKKQLAERT